MRAQILRLATVIVGTLSTVNAAPINQTFTFTNESRIGLPSVGAADSFRIVDIHEQWKVGGISKGWFGTRWGAEASAVLDIALGGSYNVSASLGGVSTKLGGSATLSVTDLSNGGYAITPTGLITTGAMTFQGPNITALAEIDARFRAGGNIRGCAGICVIDRNFNLVNIDHSARVGGTLAGWEPMTTQLSDGHFAIQGAQVVLGRTPEVELFGGIPLVDVNLGLASLRASLGAVSASLHLLGAPLFVATPGIRFELVDQLNGTIFELTSGRTLELAASARESVYGLRAVLTEDLRAGVNLVGELRARIDAFSLHAALLGWDRDIAVKAFERQIAKLDYQVLSPAETMRLATIDLGTFALPARGGGTVQAQGSTVPEPAPALMMAIAVVLFVLSTRRRVYGGVQNED